MILICAGKEISMLRKVDDNCYNKNVMIGTSKNMERDKMNKESFSFVIYVIRACADAWHKKPVEVYRIF